MTAAVPPPHQTTPRSSTVAVQLDNVVFDEAPKAHLLDKKLNQLRLSGKSQWKEDHDSGVDIPSPAYENEADGEESGEEEDAFSKGGSTLDNDASRHDKSRGKKIGHAKLEQQKLPASPREQDEVDCGNMSDLLPDDSDDEEGGRRTIASDAEIQHAPLLVSDIIDSEKRLVPQYGLMGSHKALDMRSKLFLNTNTPFSAFICGVQGSGKSHTTACILENSLVQSKKLGHLESPLSALVFSYGHFSGDGSGYSISEAAFLACPSPQFPKGGHVKKINVLVAPSNYIRISRLYLRIPNVTVTKFMMDPSKLDISTMLTLMNVSESEKQPLYMAQVTQILREMATSGASFNYGIFKQRLQQQRFDPVQTNMLQMRLNLLESFLDLKKECPEPRFAPGEITIMDMSCPFVDANTACILFNIGLGRYLASDTTGKMIVLDEAHKVRKISSHCMLQH